MKFSLWFATCDNKHLQKTFIVFLIRTSLKAFKIRPAHTQQDGLYEYGHKPAFPVCDAASLEYVGTALFWPASLRGERAAIGMKELVPSG